MKQLMDHFTWNPSDTLISIGCGSAWWEVNLLIHRPCGKIILVDTQVDVLNEEAVEDSIQYFKEKTALPFYPKFEVHNLPLNQLALDPQSIDGIFIFNAWHEFDQIEELIQAMKQLIKPSGWIILEEELSIQKREIHEGCGKKLYFQEEIDQQMASKQFQLRQKVPKEKHSFYLEYRNL
ncbi:class I SAM-dependent methyltransferase [Aquirufa sp. OSTEICH-129A]